MAANYKFWKQLGPELSLKEGWEWAKQLILDMNKRDSEIAQGVVPPGFSVVRRAPIGVPPAGYLYEDGTSYTTEQYPALFAAIGYTFGGAGANFNVPNSGSANVIKY